MKAKGVERLPRLLLGDRVWSDPEPGTRRGEVASLSLRREVLGGFHVSKVLDALRAYWLECALNVFKVP